MSSASYSDPAVLSPTVEVVPTTIPKVAEVGKPAVALLGRESAKVASTSTEHNQLSELELSTEPHRNPGWQPSRERQERVAAGIDWPIVSWLALLHVGALAAPFTFSWSALAVTVFLHWLSGGFGICLGFHRLLTHNGFKTYRWVKYFFAWIGGIAGEGTAIDWVANHRKHHKHSDHDGDPHSPNDGVWWSHAHWLGYLVRGTHEEAYQKHWAPDLARDPIMRFIGMMFLPTHFLMGAALFGIGYWLGGTYMGCSWLVWGMFVRLVAVLHTTWFVNSASHIWGYRNYETTDNSRNLWWVGLLAYGEGWHNNHHAYPRMAMHGHKWWEFDLTYRVIQLMKLCGLAWDVVDYKHRKERMAVPKAEARSRST